VNVYRSPTLPLADCQRLDYTHRIMGGRMYAGRQTAAGHDRILGPHSQGNLMKQHLATTLMVIGVLLGPVVALAGEDADADRSHPKAFVKDSAITTKVKTKLAAEHITSLGNIHVDTDADGVVWLHGTAHTQEAADKAVAVARSTEGVKAVHSRITVKLDD
jgi:hyperosmotically inducible periplasmic protein